MMRDIGSMYLYDTIHLESMSKENTCMDRILGVPFFFFQTLINPSSVRTCRVDYGCRFSDMFPPKFRPIFITVESVESWQQGRQRVSLCLSYYFSYIYACICMCILSLTVKAE